MKPEWGMNRTIRPRARSLARTSFEEVADSAAAIHERTGVGTRFGDEGNAILVYHHVGPDDDEAPFGTVTPERLRADLQFLQEAYSVVPLSEVAGDIDGPAVALTVDDGYRSVHTEVLPLLREFGFPATVFVSPGLIGDRNPELVATRHGVSPAKVPMLTDEEVSTLAAEPLVELGNHSQTHPSLAEVDSPDRLHREIVGARDRLQDRYGVAVGAFSYPHGAASPRARVLVEQTHAVSVTTAPFLVEPPCETHGLPRVGGHHPPARLRWELSPLSDRLNRLRYATLWSRAWRGT